MANPFCVERACDDQASLIKRMAALWMYREQCAAGTVLTHAACEELMQHHTHELLAFAQTVDMAYSLAVNVRLNAHAPYSKFLVGCAVIDEAGSIHVGCNVENASFGLTQCAERAAITAAVASGNVGLVAAVLVTDTKEPVMPCGACRQVMAEFGLDIVVVSRTMGHERSLYVVDDLLPLAFTSW